MLAKYESGEMDQLFKEWMRTGDYPINDDFFDIERAFDARPHESILGLHSSDMTQAITVCQTPATIEAVKPVLFSVSNITPVLDGDQIRNTVNGICAKYICEWLLA
ncbi:hypothetical protein MMC14_007286 [Varicellaria rhodocarpa]|nr:hypothetical protein [Varicellaria rhodocarpa]